MYAGTGRTHAPATALGHLELVRNRDLSAYDPDGPLPDIAPDVSDRHIARAAPGADASDGFLLVPHLTPTGLDEFADKAVPLLREQGVFRTEYEGPALCDHLGLAHPDDIRDERAAS
ncbi:hypothetical protein SUDANB96_00276 [Streptomyces sp. enrichment culture]